MPGDLLKISFRPVVANDLPQIRNWMDQPHWQKWWGQTEDELADICNMIEGRDTTRPFLFLVDDQPKGYIQYWFVGHYQNRSWIRLHPWLEKLPTEAVGIDLSIGAADDLAKGYGSKVLNRFANMLVQFGYETIIIDPDPANIRAVRAYEKAGFGILQEFAGKVDDCLLMKFRYREKQEAS